MSKSIISDNLKENLIRIDLNKIYNIKTNFSLIRKKNAYFDEIKLFILFFFSNMYII